MTKKKNNSRTWLVAFLIILVVFLVLFARKKVPGRLETEILTPTPAPIQSIILPPGGNNSDQQYYIDKATNDLATKLNIDPSTVKVVNITEREWGDTSLGCPEKGKMYAQVITPGYEIILDVGGKEYNYHTGGKSVVTCDR